MSVISGTTVVGASNGDEVDEVSEQETPNELLPETLDDFLRDLHGETTQTPSGMPSLAFLKKHFKTKSAVIRYLHSKGHSVNAIQKHLGLRYQHVRNVLTTQLKRGPNEDFDPKDFDNSANLEKF